LKNLSLYGVLFALLLFSACANIAAPQGGPKDKEPPKLLNKSSVDSLLNFKGGQLVIEFDEYIKLDNAQKNFQISPLTKQNPKIKVKKKNLIVELPDSLLEKNTTYNLDFGNAIRDIRESNQYKDLKITFSTGSYFDSLALRGRLFDAQTGQHDSGLVLLFPANIEDSMLLKQRPLYVTRARNGNFEFKGLPNNDFKIAALVDKNSNYTYDALGEKIAFKEDLISTGNPDSALTLYSFIEEKMIDTSSKQSKKSFGKAVGNAAYSFEPNIKSGIKMDMQDTLKIIMGNNPGNINTNKIRFYENEVLDLSMTTAYDDSLGIITLFPHWEFGSTYKLILQKAFIKDTTGIASKADTLSFSTMTKEDYGSIVVALDKALNKEGAILLLYEKNREVERATNLTKNVKFDLLQPTSYKLRLLYDENENGKWDSGDLNLRKQPEITLELSQTIRLKPNWENKIEWDLNNKKKKLIK